MDYRLDTGDLRGIGDERVPPRICAATPWGGYAMNAGLLMSEADYSALPGLRASYVKQLISSTPAHLFARRNSEDADTDALRIGRALHCRGLRPADYAAEFVTSPKFDRRTKDGKAAAEAFALVSVGRAVIDETEQRQVDAMVDAINLHPSARAVMDAAPHRERVYTGDIAGVPAKCRVDAVGPGVLVDVKTTISAHPRAFARSCADYGYHYQLAMYRALLRQSGVTVDDAVLVAVEKTPPYAVAVYVMRSHELDAAMSAVEGAALLFDACERAGAWPGYPQTIEEIAMPVWSLPNQ